MEVTKKILMKNLARQYSDKAVQLKQNGETCYLHNFHTAWIDPSM